MSPACRPRSRGALAAALACALATSPRAARPDEGSRGPVVLDAPGAVWGLRVADADGDGVKDLLVVSGREIHLWRGAKGAPFPRTESALFRVPEGATFVAPGRVLGDAANRVPSLLALGRTQALRLVPGGGAAVEEGLEVSLPWGDPTRAVLGDFVEGKSLFLPTPDGLRWVPDWVGARADSVLLPLRPARTVTAAGPFVEDGATVRVSWPKPFLVPAWAPAGGAPAVFSVGADALHAFVRGGDGAVVERTWSTAFLGREGAPTQSLVDFDADGTPDLVNAVTTNDSGAYVFFRTPPPALANATPTAPAAPLDLRPARGSIRLKGFQLPIEFPDLDGDGRPDVVVTTIDVDGSNVTRAVLRGRVVAKTRAFVNRSAKGAEFFAPTPDAVVESEIGVQILFTYSGSIDVKRSFTILTTADLDGDGRKDLVIRSGPETLAVYRGAAEGVWASSPTELSIPAVGKSPDVEGYAGDLDGDGKDDLVLLYRAPPGGSDRTVVLLSR
jgi:hypothetical protein